MSQFVCSGLSRLQLGLHQSSRRLPIRSVVVSEAMPAQEGPIKRLFKSIYRPAEGKKIMIVLPIPLTEEDKRQVRS